MKTNRLHLSDLICILNFTATSKQACSSNGIYNISAMWYVQQFMTKFAAANLASCLHFNYENTLIKPEGILSFWKEVIHPILHPYATHDVIVETEKEMRNFKHLSNMTPN